MKESNVLTNHSAVPGLEEFITTLSDRLEAQIGGAQNDFLSCGGSYVVQILTTGHKHFTVYESSLPVIPVLLGASTTLVGPISTEGGGCLTCLATRRDLAGATDADNSSTEVAWWEQHDSVQFEIFDQSLALLVTDSVKMLVSTLEETGSGPVIKLDNRTLQTTLHHFLRDPLCDICGNLPDDSAELAVLRLEGTHKPSPTTYRARDASKELSRLQKTYVDSECGVVHSLRRDTQGGLAVAAAIMTLRRNNWKEPGFGRSRNYEESEATAILEAVERYGGVQPGGKRTVITACFEDVQTKAIDPRRFGVHPAATYANIEYPFQAFSQRKKIKWVWAWSLTADRAVLVPEFNAYYYVAHDESSEPFTAEVSNGCALGGTLTEAIFHGLLEVVERDAFLLTWFAKLSIPELDISSATDAQLRIQIGLLEKDSGYVIRLFDQTTDNGIPTVWALAENPTQGADGRPATVSAAGAHPSLERAALAAVSELGPFLRDFVIRFSSLAEKAEEMVDDPYMVKTMSDHATAFGSPRSWTWLNFLRNATRIRFDESPANSNQFLADELAVDLKTMISRFAQLDQEVIVVDQTTPEHEAAGLSCVKVLVTGSLTMTFGHHLRRIDGIPRLEAARYANGLPAVETEDQILPHPFP